VDRERAGGTRFEVSHGAKALPIAGREAEIGLLRERWQSACTGEGQVVLLSGEAGMGKSRIVQELRHAAETVPHFALRYQCSPFHRNSALYPITAQLRMGCGIEDTDPPAVRLNKVRLLAAQAGTASEADIRLLDSLLSMPAAGNDATPALTAEEFKRDVLRVLLAQLLGLAAQKPVLMLFEDAHWMDPTTIEVVSETLMHIPSARVLIVITYRPDFKADWANAAHVTTLALSGLPRRHVLAIIDRVAGKKLPDELVELIIANTDGIPLFVEELTKTALELGIVHERNGRFELACPKATLTIPITLQDSLLARLDRHPAIKELAQVAAVIGREFSMDHLSALASSKGETLQAGIRELLRAELVHQRGGADRGTFIFKHALIQEAAYRTLIGARRQGLHARFAEFLLGLSTEFGETPPEVIAHHFTEAHQPERAIPYWLKAGQNAARRSANVEAIAHLRQGLQLIPQLADPAGQLACELRLQTEIGVPLIATHGYAAPETMVAWERTRALAEQLGEDAPLLRATYGLWAARMSAGQTRMALALSNRLIETGERTGDTGVRIVGLRVRGLTMHAMAEMPQARADLETAVSAYNPDQHSQLGLKFGQNPRMAANAILATVLWGEGRPNQARQLSLATVDEAVAFGHTNTLAYVLAYGACVVAMLRGDTAETERLADQLIAVARNNRLFLWEAYGEAYKGWAIRKAPGQADEAMRLLERSRNGFQRAGSALYQPLFDAIIASQLGLAGRCSDAVQRLRDAVEETERREELWCLPELLRLQARLVSCIGETAQAGDLLERALQVAREHRLLGWSLRVACDIARRLRDAGDHGRIAPLLQPIMDEFPEPEHTADWRRALALLADGGAYAARRETSSTAGSTNV
jgi:tetratricopeptide (TPR) repeat protein